MISLSFKSKRSTGGDTIDSLSFLYHAVLKIVYKKIKIVSPCYRTIKLISQYVFINDIKCFSSETYIDFGGTNSKSFPLFLYMIAL